MVNRSSDSYDDDYDDAHDSGHDSALVTAHDKKKLSGLANSALKNGAAAMSDADIGKTEKVFGIDVDSGLVAYVSSIYNVAADNIGQFLLPKAYPLATALGEKAGLVGKPLKRTAAAVTFVAVAGMKSLLEVNKLVAEISKHRDERKKMVQDVAPVLDDIKGHHSLRALAAVTSTDNEVIYAHRKRLERIAKSESTNKLISMLVSVVPSVALDVPMLNHMWGGKHPKDFKAPAKTDSSGHSGGDGTESLGNLGRTFVNTTTAQVADRITKSNEMKLRKGLQPYSALEMILELQKQVESDPKSGSFQMPKGFQGANKRPESYPLEEYLGLIFIQHQRDMANLKDDHTEIREALHEDVTAAVKPIATAIRSGQLSVMSLVRLVGEGKIIKNQGRAIADPEEVTALIKGSNAYVHTDLEGFYKTYPRKEIKAAAEKLEGRERQIYLMLLPDAVKKDIGLSKKEIEELHADAKKNKNGVVADFTAGVHTQSKEALKQDGLAKKEILELDAAYAAIKRDGKDAIADFMTSPTKPDGIEGVLLNWAQHEVQAGKHLGTVIEKGHAKLESLNNTPKDEPEADDMDMEMAGHHSGRERGRRNHERGAELE